MMFGSRNDEKAGQYLLFGAISVLLCGVTFSQVRVYAKLAGVDGESKRAGRRDWIDVVRLGTSVLRDSGVETGRTSITPDAGPFIFRKRIDKASPYLLEGMLQGRLFESLRIEIEDREGVETAYRMRGVRLASHQMNSKGESSEIFEEVGFQYDVIEWHDFVNGGATGPQHVGSTWNLATNEGGVLQQPDGRPPGISPVPPLQVKPGERVEFKVSFSDPAQVPENLVFTALSPNEGLVKVLEVSGEGLSRTISLQVGDLQNGSDRMTLSLTDGVRSSTRELPIVIAGEMTAYESYLGGYLNEEMAEDPKVIRPLRDPDGDEMSNVMEFFLGTDPSAFTSRDDAFTIVREKTKEGTEMVMRYYRRADESNLQESFEGSRDLSTWQRFGDKGNPEIKITTIGRPTNGYVLTEARVLIESSPQGDGAKNDAAYYMRLSVKGTL